jgi:hypothetical protein
MKRTYKKKSNLINKTGYTPGYATEKNPVNYIPSESITMANTPYPLYATPLDENGNAMSEGMMMQPGGEYKFPGASYVAETPMFEKGGEKRDWISAKISKLVREEGYPQKQAVAMAYEMYDNMHRNGGYQLPMYQVAGTYNFGSALPKPKFSADPNIATPEQFSEQMNKITEVNPGKYGLGKDPNYVNALSEQSLTAGEDFKKRTDEMNKAAGLPQNFSTNIFGETNTTQDKSKVATLDVKGQEPFQFFNPYGGFDIPTAASTLGSSIEGGDTLGTVASGLKLATGLARNFFGGMGQERRKNYLTQQSYEKQREGMIGAGKEQIMEAKFGGYYQDGGEQEAAKAYEARTALVLNQQQQDLQNYYDNSQGTLLNLPPRQPLQTLPQQPTSLKVARRFSKTVVPTKRYDAEPINLSEQDLQDRGIRLAPRYQEGGMQPGMEEEQGMEGAGQEQQMMQEVAQMLQQGADPQQVIQQLVQMGVPQDQAVQMVQAIMQQMQGSTPQLKRGGMMYYQDGGEDEEDEEEGYEYEDEEEPNYMINKPSLMGKQQNFSEPTLATSPAIESAVEATSLTKEEEETPSYDKNSARDTWVAKTGMPWSEAKKLGYTDGSAKGNIKLLSELNDPRFKKDFLRKKPLSPAKSSKKNYTREELWGESPINPLQRYTSNTSKVTTDKKIKNNETPDFVKQFLPNNNSKDFMSGQQYPLPVSTTKKPESRVSWETYRDWLNDNAPTIFQPRAYKSYQDGGEQQIAQQVAQAMQQGMQPQEAMSMLMESGMTEDQAVQMVQAIMQQLEQQPETPQLRRGGGYYQQGGEAMDEQMEGEDEGMENESAMLEQIESQIEEALKQGADPQQVLQQLVEMGMPEEQAMQMIQEILQEIQGGETDMEEPGEGTPQMSKGGKYMRALVGKTIKNYTYNPKTDSYIVSYE